MQLINDYYEQLKKFYQRLILNSQVNFYDENQISLILFTNQNDKMDVKN